MGPHSGFQLSRLAFVTLARARGNLLFDEILGEMQVSTRCCCMKRCPFFGVTGVHISSEFDEKLHHFFTIIDAALKKQSRETVIRGETMTGGKVIKGKRSFQANSSCNGISREWR